MPMARSFIAGLAGAATALLFSAATAIGDEAWNYADPTTWKDIKSSDGDKPYADCGKPIQSPIDLAKPTHHTWTGRRARGPAEGSPFGLYAAPTIALKAKYDGHTVEVEAPEGANVLGFGMDNICGPGAPPPCKERAPGDRGPFYLAQMHFHAPSEHTLPAWLAKDRQKNLQQQFPLEAHFVHVSRDKPERIAVLAVMFRAGKENAALTGLVAKLSDLTVTATTYDGSIDLRQLIPPVGKNGYWPPGYYYWGSKTTPPCTGGVFWYVAKEPVEASQAQIDALATKLNNNNRPIQKREGRNLGFYD